MTEECRPTDRILDRHCQSLAPYERTDAHQRLRQLARIVLRVGGNAKFVDIPTGDSTEREEQVRIPSLPPI